VSTPEEELAKRFFAEVIEPGLRESGASEDDVEHLRGHYVWSAVGDPAARRDIREFYGLPQD
jgi:hypothetical protein